MRDPGQPGRCVAVEVSAAERVLLHELAGWEEAPSASLDERLSAAGPVDVVVIGSRARSSISLAQRVHRAAPDAGVAVLSDDVPAVHRQASFSPDVPLDLLIASADEEDLLPRLRRLRESTVERRRHAAILAAAVRHAATAAGTTSSPQTSVGALLEHAPLAVLVTTPEGDLLGWNRRAESLLELRPERSGEPLDAIVPGARSLITSVARSGSGLGPDTVRPPLQARIADRYDVELSAVASQTDQGRPVVLLLAADVTAHRQAERERDRLAGHVELLGRISESLLQSLDLSQSLGRLARTLVPALADWVSIQVREEHDQLYDIAMHHRDPALSAVARQAEQLKAQRNCFTEPSRRAAGGEHVLLPRADTDRLVDLVPDLELRKLVARLGMGSVVAVPIPGRVGLLGSLLLANAPGGDSFGKADLALAVEIGRRAGIALDNARLYAGQRHVATELQQSLLTPPPSLPRADIAVRYVAAAQEAQVGGDWYDAFCQRGGDLLVVIGDVVGHDTRAAAAMGQLRALLRGIAFTTAEGPSRVLTSVDEAIRGLQLGTMATAVLAQLSFPAADEGSAGVRLHWSNAGHPPPVLLDPGGHARVLTARSGKADLLLGIDAGTVRTTEHTTLAPGSTLLLYTDGLVERREHTLDDGLRTLLALVEEHGDEELGGFCDAILSTMVPKAGQDDVAILAVRTSAGGGAG